MSRCGLLAALLVVLLAGCPPDVGPIMPPRSVDHALQRVNDNLSRIDDVLYCGKCVVSFDFRDADGRTHRFRGHPATLIFERPRCLYLDIKHALGGSVARLGSNDERYWVWIEPEVFKMWWGTWAALERGEARRLPVPPNELLDALMLRPLPERLAGDLRPLLRVEKEDHRLVFVRLDEDGQPYGMREIALDPRAPFLPIEISDWREDGQLVMRARLSDYARLGADGPYTARRYAVEWPLDGAEVRLQIQKAKFRPDQPPFCDFPAGWEGQIELIDE